MRRTYTILAVTVAVAIALILHLGGQPTAEASPDTVLKGFNLFETDSTQTSATLTLGAGFFGPGCAAFTGTIDFAGVPFDTYTLKSPLPSTSFTGLSPTDTIVQRIGDAGPSFPSKIGIKIVKLSLQSINSIVVACPSGTQVWNTKAEVPENDQNQAIGTMTIRHQLPNGGTYDATLPVRPTLTFTEKTGPGLIGPFLVPLPDTMEFHSTNVPWCHSVTDPLVDPAGDTVVQIPGLTSNFFPGIPCGPSLGPPPKVTGGGPGTAKQLTVEEAELAEHGVKTAENKRGPVGGLSRDPAVGAAPLQSDPASGSAAWLLTGGLVIAAASVVVLGGGAWYVRRRRTR
jgi:hypothetical protein